MRRTGYQRKEIRGSAAGRPGRVRLIAGRFRGRRIAVAPVPGLRPTPERTRETLFNWLQGRIEGARVLDLFAGSGALGFEALSRGADRVVLVEQDRAAHATLQRTAAELDPERTEAVRDDALRWPRVAAEAFDLVFLDPPFAAGLAVAALARQGLDWIARARGRRGAVPARAAPALLAGWRAAALLDQAARAPERVAQGGLVQSEFARRGGLLLRAATGRW